MLLELCILPVFTNANIQIVYSKQADEGKCNGVIVVEATGDAGPFDIILNGEVVAQNFSGRKYFTGLCSGEYSFIISNLFACETPLNMVIHECGQISVVGLQSGIYPPSACGEQDGSFGFAHGVSATGGTGSYSFILKDHNGDILPMEEYGGWENLGAGDYHLTIIDENGCQGEEEFTIEGEDIEVSYGASPECEYSANGYIWAYAYAPASGSSTQTYHYEWSTGDEFESSEGILLEGLSAGTYIVTVSTENGACTYTETIVVEGLVSEAPLSVEAEVINTCPQYPSGHIELQVSGGVPRLNSTHFSYSIQWEDYNSLYNQRRYDLEAGNYTVTVTDLCGNTITETYTIGTFPDYSIEVADIDHICPDETSGAVDINLVGGDGPFTAYWYNEGENFPSIASTIDLSNVPGGSYRVKAYDRYGCKREKGISILSSSLDDITADITGSCPELDEQIGSISLNVNTPFPLESVSWSYQNAAGPTLENLEPGIYSATITDSECVYHVDYEVAELIYSYTTGNGTEDKCWTTETCGSHSRTFYSGITNWERPEGECRIRIDCGNGSWWFSPTGEIHYVYSGILINDATDEVECTRRKYCTLHWDYVTPNLATAINIDLEEEEVEVINPDPVVYYDGQCPESEGGGLKEVFQCGLGEEAVIIDIDCSQAKPPPSSPNNSRPALFQEKIRVVPNPFAEEFVIRLPDADEELARITVLDVYGRPVFEYSRALRNGETLVSLRGFPAGIYYLTVKAKEAEYRSLVVKTH